jgi:major membrane immunogen (membrane-anchored lipoprotein)
MTRLHYFDKSKRKFCFFADPQKNKNKECLHTLAHLPAFPSHKSPTHEGRQKSQSADTHNNFKKQTAIMKIIYMIICVLLLFSCSSKTNKDENTQSVETINNSISSDNNNCKIDDGTYSATVDYNNPETGYSQTYTLDVEVQDCQVVQINFPNDGYLDEDHISAAIIDEDGNASVDGENGKTYEVHIDN